MHIKVLEKIKKRKKRYKDSIHNIFCADEMYSPLVTPRKALSTASAYEMKIKFFLFERTLEMKGTPSIPFSILCYLHFTYQSKRNISRTIDGVPFSFQEFFQIRQA